MPLMTPKVAKELSELIAAFPDATPEQNSHIREALTAIAHKQKLNTTALTPTQEVILQTIKEYALSKPASQIQHVLEACVAELTPTTTPGRTRR